MKRKICVVITARASYSRMKTALLAIKAHPLLTLELVASGSAISEKYGMVVNQIKTDGFDITACFSNMLEGSSPADSAKTVALAMVDLSTFFSHSKPDIVITIADRFETTATAFVSALMNITLVHIQGGEVSGNIDDKVRNAITQLADYHFVATKNAGKRIISMGISEDTVFITGCPSIDLISDVSNEPEQDFNPLTAYGGVGPSFNLNSGYLVVMQHPVTNEYLFSGDQTLQTLRAIEKLEIPTFWFWPNSDPGTEGVSKMIRTYREHRPTANIHLFKSIEPVHFLTLLKNSLCLIGNSSVGIRECSSMGVPVVNIGSRQKGRERGRNVMDVPYEYDAIMKAIKQQVAHGHYQPEHIYGNGNSGVQMAEILTKLSLTAAM